MRRPSTPRRAQFCAAGTAMLAVAGPFLSGCGSSPDQPAAAAAPAAAKVVGVVPVTVGDRERTITQPATIQGIEEATLYARAAGYLKSISVDKGDRVRAGQVLAVIESPELLHQQDQARAVYQQARANHLGVEASQRRAKADVGQAEAAIERARAEARHSQAVVSRARAEQSRVEAQLPKLQALISEAEANVSQAVEQQAQAQTEVLRHQQQLKGAQASLRAVQSALDKAQSEARLHQLTYNRLKAIQDKDSGLIAGQEVDVARARMETSQNEVEAARNRLDASRQEVGSFEQQVESARRNASAAARRVDSVKSKLQAAKEDVRISQREVEAAAEQVKVAAAQAESAERQIAVAEAQRRSMREQVAVAAAQIAVARQRTEGDRSALSTASVMADYARIVAPYDGVITERLADTGAFVQNASGNQAGARGIVKLVRDQSLRILIPVPEADLPHIRNGQKAVVRVDAYPKQEFPGKVTRSAAAIDAKSRTLLTEVDLVNPGGRLRPGMFARVTLTLETHRGALSVPSETVMGKDDDRSVYLVVDGKAQKTPVKVGIDDGKMAQIVEGLSADAQVVLVGRDSLVNGAPVKAEPAKVEAGKK